MPHVHNRHVYWILTGKPQERDPGITRRSRRVYTGFIWLTACTNCAFLWKGQSTFAFHKVRATGGFSRRPLLQGWNSPLSTEDSEGTTVPAPYSKWGWNNDVTVSCGKEKSKFLDKNLPSCNFAPHKSHITLELNPGLRWEKPSTNNNT
jgi:hypothetical protein